MIRGILVLLLALIIGGILHASAAGKPVSKTIHHELKTDTSQLNIRQFDTTAIKKYLKDPAFNYVPKERGLTWWDHFWEWVWSLWNAFWLWVAHIMQKLFGSGRAGKNVSSILKYVIIGIAAFLIVYVILKLIGIDLLKLFRKKQPVTEVPYTEFIENIHEMNFDDAIENALAVKDYRLAVRLLYLRSLKQLSDSHIINWKADKTNYAYLNEIADPEQRRQFTIVTRQFEYVWYGDFPVDGASFQNINTIFQEFKHRIA